MGVKVLNYRKSSKAIHEGKTIHFAPDNGVYTLFRILEDEVVAVIINKNGIPVNLDLKRFQEIGVDGKILTNINYVPIFLGSIIVIILISME